MCAVYGNASRCCTTSRCTSEGQTLAVVGESGSASRRRTRHHRPAAAERRAHHLRGKELPKALKGRNNDELRRIQMIYRWPYGDETRARLCAISSAAALLLTSECMGRQEDRAGEGIARPESMGTRFPRSLSGRASGGQKQRVAIARGLPPNRNSSFATKPNLGARSAGGGGILTCF